MKRNLVFPTLIAAMFLALPIRSHADGPSILTLDDALARALARDDLVCQARQSLDAARRSLVQAKAHTPRMLLGANSAATRTAGLDPQSEITGTQYSGQSYSTGIDIPLDGGTNLSLSTLANTSTTNSKFAQGGGAQYTYAGGSVGLVLSRPISLFRNERVLTEAPRRSAEFSLQAAELALEDARRSVVADTFAHYFDAVRAQRRAETAVQSQRETDELLRIAREKLKRGKIAEIDVMEAQVSADSARTFVRASQSDLVTQMDQLKGYLGIPLDDPLQVVDPSQSPEAPNLAEDELVKQALENRTDLRQLGLQVRSAELSLRQAKTRSRPGIVLNCGYIRSGGGASIFNCFGNLINPAWNIGFSTAMSLSHEEDRAAISQASGSLALAQTQERLQREQVRLEIRRMMRQVTDSASSISQFSETVKQAEENLRVRQVQLDHGLARPIDVMQTEGQLTLARRQYNDALIDYQLARVQLDLAVGAHQIEAYAGGRSAT